MRLEASASSVKLQQTSTPHDGSEFIQFTASMRLPIPPVFAANGNAGGPAGSGGMDGVREVLTAWLMRYLPPLRSVLLAFDPIPTFDHPSAEYPTILSPFPEYSRAKDPFQLLRSPEPNDDDNLCEETRKETRQFKSLPMIVGSGFTLATVIFKGLGWSPRVGQRVVGTPTLSTPSHISLLLHDLFNASIPASQIPIDVYHFDPHYPIPISMQQRRKLSYYYSAEIIAATETEAEVKQEEATASFAKSDEQNLIDHVGQALEQKRKVQEEEENYSERGWWIHTEKNEPLGGVNGRIDFTIVSLTIANSMISATGSLLADPFAAGNHIPNPPATNIRSRKRRRADSDPSSSSSRSPSPASLKAPPRIFSSIGPEDPKVKAEHVIINIAREDAVKLEKRGIDEEGRKPGGKLKKDGTEPSESAKTRHKLDKKERKRLKKEAHESKIAKKISSEQ